jgi:hypothetical protein
MTKSNPFSPTYDYAAGLVYVPVIGEARTAIMEIETFEAIENRKDLLSVPLRMGRDYGTPAIRAKALDALEGQPGTVSIAALLAVPNWSQKAITVNSDPFDLRRSNVVAVARDSQPVAH